MIKGTTRLALVSVMFLALLGSVRAEEVEKKFRVGLSLGTGGSRGSVESDSANTLTIVNQQGAVTDFIRDPRNDSAALGALKIEPSWRATVSAQYAFTRHFVLEGSVGYQRGDVANVELQAQFPNQTIPTNQSFDFQVYNFRAGTIQQIPVQVTAMARFRPKAMFNPYFGAGLGYIFVSFDPSSQLDEISTNMSRSEGAIATLLSNQGVQSLLAPTIFQDLTGASISAPSTWEWHLAGGFELSFKKHWAFVADLRYVVAQKEFQIGFDGSSALGVSVPRGVQFEGQTGTYGPMFVAVGGLVDVGRNVQTYNPDTQLVETKWVFEPDGVPDPGYYYVQGGTLKYDGTVVQVGFKYTF